MVTTKSRHDIERDKIADEWQNLGPFICAACKSDTPFPMASNLKTEARYKGLLRADVATFDDAGHVLGVVEVVCSHPPTSQALAAQESLSFAYYRLMPPPGRNSPSVWLCSPECWEWFIQLSGTKTISPWEPPRCDFCGTYFHENRLSWFEFRDWSDDPNHANCIHGAATIEIAQWRTPGELIGGDPREWEPDDDADPATLLLSYFDAAFWSMVWTRRVVKLDEDEVYNGYENEAAENATSRRLPLVKAAFDAENWSKGADLLLPIGALGWADFPGESERLLAFRPNNCQGTAEAWYRLLIFRLGQLPVELAEIVRLSQWGICLSCKKLIHKSEPHYPTCEGCGGPKRTAEKARRKAQAERLLAEEQQREAERQEVFEAIKEGRQIAQAEEQRAWDELSRELLRSRRKNSC